MGFDLFGTSGNYFRANVWSWRPIVGLIEETGLFDDEILGEISRNNGFPISGERARELADRLEAMLPDLPEEIQAKDDCGLRVDDDGRCIAQGNGSGRDPHWTDKEHLEEFIDFCRESDGFEVW